MSLSDLRRHWWFFSEVFGNLRAPPPPPFPHLENPPKIFPPAAGSDSKENPQTQWSNFKKCSIFFRKKIEMALRVLLTIQKLHLYAFGIDLGKSSFYDFWYFSWPPTLPNLALWSILAVLRRCSGAHFFRKKHCNGTYGGPNHPKTSFGCIWDRFGKIENFGFLERGSTNKPTDRQKNL